MIGFSDICYDSSAGHSSFNVRLKTAAGFITVVVAIILIMHLWNSREPHSIISEAYMEYKPIVKEYLRRHEHCSEFDPCLFMIVADMDHKSRDTTDPTLFHSVQVQGSLYSVHDKVTATRKFHIKWEEPEKIVSKHSEGGRGMELSELLLSPEGRLLSVDDRTGLVYEHMKLSGGNIVVPRYVVTEGNGNTNKGMKIEWASIKDNDIWLGSFGKEFTGISGEILSLSNFWVAAITPFGEIKRYDWTSVYEKIRRALGVPYPGYATHEAVNWSSVHNRWVFLPRRVSAEPYDEVLDEMRGSNKMVVCDANFENIVVREIGQVYPLKGFSTFKFVPGSNDQFILALKSVEDSIQDIQRTFISVFTYEGKILMEDVDINLPYKFEGLEFIASNHT